MAEEYISYPLDDDAVVMLEEYIAELRAYWPNFEPADGALARRAPAAIFQQLAERLAVASQIPDEIFRQVGVNLHNIPTIEGVASRADTKWVVRDAAGYRPIPAGTLVSVAGVRFETTEEIIIPSGTREITPVGIIALETGETNNNLGREGTEIELVEPFDYVTSVRLNAATTGGVEQESLEEYLTRAKTLLQLASAKAITTQNLADLAQTVKGVAFATAIKGYDAERRTFENEGVASVAVRDEAATAPVPLVTKEEVRALLEGPGERLINNIIYVIDPTWTRVDITYEAVAFPEADPAVVREAADNAVRLMFEPNEWGRPLTGQQRRWANKTVVSIYDIAQTLGDVEGLDRVNHIRIGFEGREQAERDAELTGVAPLPLPGRIEGAVRAP